MLNAGERRQEASRVRSMTGSLASPQRSSVYKTALLDAQAETQRALAGLASTRVECNEQHLAIVENIKVMQTTMRESLQVSGQLRTAQNVQNARVDTLGHRMGEMNDMLMARELRVETQINDLSNQMHAVLNAIDVMRRERSLPRQPSASGGVRDGGPVRVSEPTYPSQAVKSELLSALKPSTSKPAVPVTRKDGGVAGNLVLATPDAERKPARKATLGSQTEETAFTTAPISMSGPDSLYLTADLSADHGLPSGTPCASSTRKKDEIADLSMQATHGSHDRTREVEAKVEEGEAISPEQLRFTAAISKAMSKELAPLLAGRDLAQARPNVYRGSKDGSIDGWILIMQRYLKRTQTKVSAEDQAWSIIGHLEREARNYIINKAESERDTPEKVFELLYSRFGAGGNRMQVRQAFQSRIQHEKEDWMQYLDALEGLRSQGFPHKAITTKRYEILQRFMEGVRDPALRRELAIVYASEVFLTEPPTVESLRFTTRQLHAIVPNPPNSRNPMIPD